MNGKEPKYIITDQDHAMKRDIQDMLPRTRNRFCWWHISKNISDNNATLCAKNGNMSNEIAFLCKNSLTKDEFKISWKAIMKKYNAEENKHFQSLWELRNFWAPAYFQD
jgi:hypothetical protein